MKLNTFSLLTGLSLITLSSLSHPGLTPPELDVSNVRGIPGFYGITYHQKKGKLTYCWTASRLDAKLEKESIKSITLDYNNVNVSNLTCYYTLETDDGVRLPIDLELDRLGGLEPDLSVKEAQEVLENFHTGNLIVPFTFSGRIWDATFIKQSQKRITKNGRYISKNVVEVHNNGQMGSIYLLPEEVDNILLKYSYTLEVSPLNCTYHLDLETRLKKSELENLEY